MAAGSLGWRGFLRLGTTGPVLPYLNADLTENIEVNPSQSIHGGGVGTVNGIFHSEHNFAIGRATFEGTINGEVFGGTGNYGAAFRGLLERGVGASSGDTSLRDEGFDAATPLIFSPGGGFQFKFPDSGLSVGKAVVNTFAINGNNGGNVQYTTNIMSSGADFDTSAVNAPNVADFAFETAGLTDDSNPLPYYATNFNITATGESDLSDRVTDYNVNINNNSTPIFTFNGNNFAVDILQGMSEITGTFSYYSPDGTFVRNLIHGGVLTIDLGTFTLRSPFVAFGPYPVPSPGPNDPTVRNVTFRCLATSTSASIAIV